MDPNLLVPLHYYELNPPPIYYYECQPPLPVLEGYLAHKKPGLRRTLQ